MPNDYDYNNPYSYNGNSTGDSISDRFPSLWADEEDLNRATTSCLSKVFLRMFAALLVTAAVAFIVSGSETLTLAIFGSPLAWVLALVELGLVIGISWGIKRLSPTAANVLFYIFAIVNGLTLAVIFLVYELGVIYQAFAASALMFGGMSLYGSITRRDLTAIGSICHMALIGLIIASIFNIVAHNEWLDTIICYAGILIFVGLTAYDTKRIKIMLATANEESDEIAIKKVTVIGALTLYLDFINLFLKILRLMGKRS